MDLKDFIQQTISGIVEASVELQAKYEARGVIVNPPVSVKEPDLYEHSEIGHRFRRVEVVEFDVAVTAAKESSGGGKAGLKIFSAEIGADGRHSRTSEEVSRVKFSIPIVLSPATIELQNKSAAETVASERRKDQEKQLEASRGRKRWIPT